MAATRATQVQFYQVRFGATIEIIVKVSGEPRDGETIRRGTLMARSRSPMTIQHGRLASDGGRYLELGRQGDDIIVAILNNIATGKWGSGGTASGWLDPSEELEEMVRLGRMAGRGIFNAAGLLSISKSTIASNLAVGGDGGAGGDGGVGIGADGAAGAHGQNAQGGAGGAGGAGGQGIGGGIYNAAGASLFGLRHDVFDESMQGGKGGLGGDGTFAVGGTGGNNTSGNGGNGGDSGGGAAGVGGTGGTGEGGGLFNLGAVTLSNVASTIAANQANGGFGGNGGQGGNGGLSGNGTESQGATAVPGAVGGMVVPLPAAPADRVAAPEAGWVVVSTGSGGTISSTTTVTISSNTANGGRGGDGGLAGLASARWRHGFVAPGRRRRRRLRQCL